MPTTYRLPPGIEERLRVLARRTGRSIASLTREAVLQEIELIEDYYLEASLNRRRHARGDTRPQGLQ